MSPTSLDAKVAEAFKCDCSFSEGEHYWACATQHIPAVLALVREAIEREREACANTAAMTGNLMSERRLNEFGETIATCIRFRAEQRHGEAGDG